MTGLVRTVCKGSAIVEEQVRHDKQHGLSRFIFKDGSYAVCNYKRGLKHGDSVWYQPDGSIERHALFNDGELVVEQKGGPLPT